MQQCILVPVAVIATSSVPKESTGMQDLDPIPSVHRGAGAAPPPHRISQGSIRPGAQFQKESMMKSDRKRY